MYVDDIIIYCIGKSFDEVCFKLNKVLDELRFWSFRFKLSIYFIKIEVMIFIKQGFIGFVFLILFGDKYVNVVDYIICLGLIIDNCLFWLKYICYIKKFFL